MSSNLAWVPLRDPPRHWRALAVAEALAVLALVASVLVTLSTPPRAVGLPSSVYESLLVAVVFAGPPVAGLATGALAGGLLPALGLAALPSLAWTLSVPAGYALRRALGHPLPIADSPLWAISGLFLVSGLLGGVLGFAVGRAGLLVWRRVED